jgi:hypothetical protein
MRVSTYAALLAGAISSSAFSHSAEAQTACYRYVNACGPAPGYFRPQGVTVNRYFVPEAAPGSFYAPIGPNGAYWRQFNPQTGYGPQEPNPYSQNGMLINPYRIGKHLWITRIAPHFGQW